FHSFFHYHATHLLLHSFPTRRSSDLALPRPVRKLGAGGVCPDALQSRGDRGGGREAHSPGPAPGVTEARVPASGSTSASAARGVDRKSTRLNSSHVKISYAVFCLKKK